MDIENLRMKEFLFNLPLKEEDTSQLQIGDIVYLNGLIFTGRIGFYRMLLEKKISPPIDFKNICNVNFHCSPAASEVEEGEFRISSLTGTASFRFKQWIEPLFSEYGVKAIIGKGGMQSEIYEQVFKRYKSVYLSTIGYGLGAVYGKTVKKIIDVVWRKELGLAQAMWILEVERLGPLIVDGDTSGKSLQNMAKIEMDKNFRDLIKEYGEITLKRIGEVGIAKEVID